MFLRIKKKNHGGNFGNSKSAANNGFCASGADGKNMSICAAIISSPG